MRTRQECQGHPQISSASVSVNAEPFQGLTDFVWKFPGFSPCSNPGLQLGNGFGVLGNGFGVLGNAFGVSFKLRPLLTDYKDSIK